MKYDLLITQSRMDDLLPLIHIPPEALTRRGNRIGCMLGVDLTDEDIVVLRLRFTRDELTLYRAPLLEKVLYMKL